ncbi:MAG: hypothetical protein JRD68_15475, partial [Deltaproteobacteria bacterium]|nr:hypothetical protein [Deltaproteobacteria bacterium]
DFTGDNTRDGNKDYAKVYVKTEAGLKEFKISEDETRWGTPSFTYTDKVAYQHKVYNFKIPLKELGVTKDKKIKDLELAFAAYGTDSPPGHLYPDLAFDPQTGLYLMVFVDYAGSGVGSIYGQVVNADGTPYGAMFMIGANALGGYNDAPAVAYDSLTQTFLVAWRATYSEIQGRFIKIEAGAGVPQGTGEFIIRDGADSLSRPAVAFNPNNGQFLVVWGEYVSPDDLIYGRFVDSNGPVGVHFPVSGSSSSYWSPALAFDGANNRFLVVFTRNSEVGGQLINADGTHFGSEIPITNLPSGYVNNPAVAFGSVTGQFLTVWNDSRNPDTYHDIFGQFVSATGSLNGSNFDIAIATQFQGYPALAFSSFFFFFLVVWTDYRSGNNHDIFGRFVHADMVRSTPSIRQESEFIISDSSTDFKWPRVAYSSDCLNFLTAYTAISASYTSDIALTPVGPCVNVPATQTVTLAAGTTVADYRILSFGLVPSNPDPTVLIGGQIGTYDPSLMRIAHYDNEDGNFLEFPFTADPGPGPGPGSAAWFLFRFGKTLTFSGFKTPVEPGPAGLNGFRVGIGPGWNQIGNPFDIEISVESIYVEDPANDPVKMTSGNNRITQSVFWIWVNGAYIPATTLPPGMGGWLLKTNTGYGAAFFGAVPAIRSDTSPTRVNTDGLERPPAPPGTLEASGSSGESAGGGGCFISAADE